MLTLTDLFCGAGGSSTGATMVPGIEVKLAANHWDLAIETHNANHPDADHLQADISNTDPRYIRTTDLLWASPECTNHSRAKGRKRIFQPDLFEETLPDAAAERSRATMWDVVRFAEVHQYKAIIVENVVEVVDWLPFQGWLMAMDALGYDFQYVSMNSMHAQAYGLPAPQSRDRVYIVFHRKGNKAPDLNHMQRPKAYCGTCDEVVSAMQTFKREDAKVGRYRSQYVYRCPNIRCRNQVVEPAWLPATSIIDWSIPGQRIGDRPMREFFADKKKTESLGFHHMSPKTLRRVQIGIEKFWTPIVVEHGGNPYDAADPKHPRFMDPTSYYRAAPVSEPTQTMHTRESKGIAYTPVMIPVEGRDGKQPMSLGDPLRTQTTRSESGLMFPPFIAELRGGGSTARAAADALATVTASGNHHALITSYYGNGGTQPAVDPIGTLSTVEKHAVLTRPTVNVEDVLFRMFEPQEIKQAMAFPADYYMAGNRREQVKQSGNAVTPPAARDLLATVAESLGVAA